MSILTVFSLLSSLLGLLGGSSFEGYLQFQSDESKTKEGKPVFNKIKFTQEAGLDVWEMKQSHHGSSAAKEKWDHIKIIVDTHASPMTVSYHQLNKGREVDYVANCLRCHSNGPRFIRPSPDKPQTYQEALALSYWNAKIKSYGTVSLKRNPLAQKRQISLIRPQGDRLIKSKSCIRCHKKGGARAEVSTFQKGSILYLVKNKEMPPWPYKLTSQEESLLLDELLKTQ
jgi:cytochrome c553